MATTTRLVTYEATLTMPEAHDVTEEVIDGEIHSMPPNQAPHVFSVGNLADLSAPGWIAESEDYHDKFRFGDSERSADLPRSGPGDFSD